MQFCYTVKRNMAGICDIFFIHVSFSLINSTGLELPQRFQSRTSVLRSLKNKSLFITYYAFKRTSSLMPHFHNCYSPIPPCSSFPDFQLNQEIRKTRRPVEFGPLGASSQLHNFLFAFLFSFFSCLSTYASA